MNRRNRPTLRVVSTDLLHTEPTAPARAGLGGGTSRRVYAMDLECGHTVLKFKLRSKVLCDKCDPDAHRRLAAKLAQPEPEPTPEPPLPLPSLDERTREAIVTLRALSADWDECVRQAQLRDARVCSPRWAWR